jgi:hypothetical protein
MLSKKGLLLLAYRGRRPVVSPEPRTHSVKKNSAQAPDGLRPLFLPCHLMILDVIGNFLTDGRQLKQFVFDERILCLLGLLPIHGRSGQSMLHDP